MKVCSDRAALLRCVDIKPIFLYKKKIIWCKSLYHHVKIIIISFLQFERQAIDFTVEPRFNKSCCWILFQHLQMQILIYQTFGMLSITKIQVVD